MMMILMPPVVTWELIPSQRRRKVTSGLPFSARHTAFAADDGVDDGASDDDSGQSDSIDLSEAAPDDAEGGESGGSIGKDDGSYDLSDSFIDGAPSWGLAL